MDIFDLKVSDFREFPEIAAPGVYVYLDENDNFLYVGQSGDVKARFKAHKRKKWASEIARKLYVPIAAATDRLIAETVLILRYFPRYNRTIKLGLSADGTLRELQFLNSTKSRRYKSSV